MGQWGKTLTVDGAVFVPHIDTLGFSPISTGGERITEVLLIDSGEGGREAALRSLDFLKQRFVGEPYSKWNDWS